MNPVEKFDSWNKREWQLAVHEIFPLGIPESAVWTDPAAMVGILTRFCIPNLNHTMLPLGGGLDIEKVGLNHENGSLELWTAPQAALICKPAKLQFEYFAESIWNSFLLLDTVPLDESGVYEDLKVPYEEVLELAPGEYVDRSYFDQGHLGYDEDGREIPLPKKYRNLQRFLSGKFLMVAKKSIWNEVGDTYDGRHSKLLAGEIREQIASVLKIRPGI